MDSFQWASDPIKCVCSDSDRNSRLVSAEDAYRKADADLNLSRAEVEKQRINSSIKNHQCEDNKNEYAKQLQKTNELQGQHYQVLFHDILFQESGRNRMKIPMKMTRII